jgi:hypothetical protein
MLNYQRVTSSDYPSGAYVSSWLFENILGERTLFQQLAGLPSPTSLAAMLEICWGKTWLGAYFFVNAHILYIVCIYVYTGVRRMSYCC